MASLRPLVLEGIELVPFIQYILNRHAAPSALVVCASKEIFLEQLHQATSESNDKNTTEPGHEDKSDILVAPKRPANPWNVPTLRLLASSRTIKVAFCSDIPHLRAYLAAYAYQLPEQQDQSVQARTQPGATPLLAVFNFIELHGPTSAFSAQGLNRTLSIAVEAAHRSKSRLILAECTTGSKSIPSGVPVPGSEFENEETVSPKDNIWDEEVSILNVTTKTFGAGERGWVGRTVSIRKIAERWCTFQISTSHEE